MLIGREGAKGGILPMTPLTFIWSLVLGVEGFTLALAAMPWRFRWNTWSADFTGLLDWEE